MNRLNFILLGTAMMLLSITNSNAQTIIDQGTCGANLTWVLTSDSVLTISGSGAMTNYATNDMPWYNHKNKIKSVIIDDEVTTIGNYAFYTFSEMESVEIGNSVTKIGQIAFCVCTGLTSVNIPNSVKTIEMAAFQDCSGLTSVIIGSSVATVNAYTFNGCGALTSIKTNATTPPTSQAPTNIVWGGIDATIPIYIPSNTLNAYKTSNTWSYFSNFIDDCVGIVGAGSARPIEIYPNPTTGKLTIGYPISDMRLSNIKIYDIVGKLQESRISEIGKSEIEIDISHLANGLYFLKVDNRMYKIIKN